MAKSKKQNNEIMMKKLVDNMCDNISNLLLEMGLYPGTELFDKTFYRIMDDIELEIKSRVIKRIREVIDQ